MKKVLTIGRNPQCDICIPDSTDVVSREHAILEIAGRGKYLLTSKGRNGTYVNGVKMANNEKVPVTRKDSISFAHVHELDWSLVPQDNTIRNWCIGIGALAAVILLGLWATASFNNSSDNTFGIFGSDNKNKLEFGNYAPKNTPDAEHKEEQKDTIKTEVPEVQPVKPAKKPVNKVKKQELKPEPKDTIIDAIY